MPSQAAGANAISSPGEARLEAYLKDELGLDGELSVQPVAGGQSNPTFFVTVGRRRLVLRKRPAGTLLPSAHAVDREYRVQKALAGTGVPVPTMLLYRDDPTIVGTSFYVMERVEGRIFGDSAMASTAREDRREMYASAARVLAAIHDVDIEAAGLSDFGKHGGFIQRQLKRWSQQWQLSKATDDPAMEKLIAWLRENIPATDETTLTHGDFRIGNLIYHPTEPRVIAVLDWELSTLGDPLADLAHSCAYSWHIKPDEYGGLLGVDLDAGGLPTLAEFVDEYRKASGGRRELTDYHLAFALFRNAAIFEGIAARARQGNASSADAARVGALAPLFVQRGAKIAGRG